MQARQMFPGNTFFLEAFNDATSSAYGHLLIDYKAKTPDYLRLRTNLLSDQPDQHFQKAPGVVIIMSSCMQRNLVLLEMLYKASPNVWRVIVGNASADFIKALCEVALNVIKGNIPLTTKQYKQLKKKKSVVRLVADKKVNLLKKKQTINQTGGGFLLPLLGAAIPFLTSLFNRG